MNRYMLEVLCAAVIAAATMFIEQKRISTIRWQSAKDSVQSDWAVAHFAIRFENNSVEWFYDPDDLSEARSIERLRHIYLLADAHGRVLEWSTPYKQLGLPFPPEQSAVPRIWEAKGRAAGAFRSTRYLLCTGPIRGTKGHRYQLTVGRQLG